MKKEGSFVVIEGISGSGKSTIAKKLVSVLNKNKNSCAIYNPEPTQDNAFGKTIRKIIEHKKLSQKFIQRELLAEVIRLGLDITKMYHFGPIDRVTETFYKMTVKSIFNKLVSSEPLTTVEKQMLFMCDRFYSFLYTIIPNTQNGLLVVNDRGELSTFTIGAAQGLNMEQLKKMQHIILGKLYRKPDVTFIVNVPPKIAVKRLKKSGKVKDEFETLNNLEKFSANYCEIDEQRFMGTQKEYPIVFINNEGPIETAIAKIIKYLKTAELIY